MPRIFQVEGTRSYFWAAWGLLLLGLWCAKDGWFPSDSVLLRHPPGTLEHDRFYIFNKSLSLLSLTASAVCAAVHRLVK